MLLFSSLASAQSGGCLIQAGTQPTFQEAAAGATLTFDFTVVDDPQLTSPCPGADVVLQLPTSPSHSYSPTSFTNVVLGTTVSFTVTLSNTPGTFESFTALCSAGSGCATNSQVSYFAASASDYQVNYVAPASGVGSIPPQTTTTLEVATLQNGQEYSGEVCWLIVSNPAGNASLAGIPNGTAADSNCAAGEIAHFASAGRDTINLNTGSANDNPVEVRVRIPVADAGDTDATRIIQIFTQQQQLSAVSSNPLTGNAGGTVDVIVQLDNFGQPQSGVTVTFVGDGVGVDSSTQQVVTDANGQATATFTILDSGSFSNVVNVTAGQAAPLSFNGQFAANYTVELLDPNPVDVDRGATAAVRFRLLRNGQPFSGQTATFTYAMPPVAGGTASATTDANGVATATFTVSNSAPVGMYANAVQAEFALPVARSQTKGAQIVSAAYDLNVGAVTFSLGFQDPASGSATTLVNQPVPLSVRLDRDGAPAPDGSQIAFVVQDPNGSTQPVIATTSGGIATSNFSSSLAGQYRVAATFDPNGDPLSTTDDDGDELTVTFIVDVQANNFALTATDPPNGVGSTDIGQDLNLTVQAMVNGQPAPDGTPITFSVSGTGATVAPATPTTSGGAASTTFNASAAGTYTVTASWDTDPQSTADAPITTTFAITVNNPQQPSTYELQRVQPANGQAAGAPNEDVNLTVQALVDGADAPNGTAIDWRITTPNGAIVTTPTPTSGGLATTVFNAPAAGTYTVVAIWDPDGDNFSNADDNGNEQVVLFQVVITAPQVVRTLEKPAQGSGDGQSGQVGTTLPAPLTVVAFNDGVAASGVGVNWMVTSGDATLSANATTTGADGSTQVSVSFGQTAGPVTITATRADDPNATVTFTVTADPAPQVVRTLVKPATGSGDGQSGQVGTTLPAPLSVIALDDGTAAPGIGVNWAVTSGDATLSASSTTTGADGSTQVNVTLGQTVGPVMITATRADQPNATVSFTVTADPAPQIVRTLVKPATGSGDGQSGQVGTTLPDLLTVIALNNSQPTSGIGVNWAVTSGDATLSANATTTSADGSTHVSVTFGQTAGPVTITATRADEPSASVTFTLTATGAPPPPPPAVDVVLEIVSGQDQTGSPGSQLAPLVVRAVDRATGAPVADVALNWVQVQGDGSLAAASTTSAMDGSSSNTLTLGSAGPHRVRVSEPGGDFVEFTATAIDNPPPPGGGALTLRIVSGSGQQLDVGMVSGPLVVEVVNADGEGVGGISLSWTADNAAPTASTSSTGSDGRSQNTARVLASGPATVTVAIPSSPNVSPVTFALNGALSTAGLNTDDAARVDRFDDICASLRAMPSLTTDQQDLLAICRGVGGLSPTEVSTILDEVIGTESLVLAQTAFFTARAQLDNLRGRLQALRSGRGGALAGLAIAMPDGILPLSMFQDTEESGQEDDGSGSGFDRWGFFASGILGRGEYDPSTGQTAFDFDINGLTAGVDYRFTDQIAGGVALGLMSTDTKVIDGGDLDASGLSVNGYVTWFNEQNWYVDGVLGFGRNDYDAIRLISFTTNDGLGNIASVDQRAKTSTSGDLVSAAVSFGRDFNRGGWNYGPYGRLTYVSVGFDEYAEELQFDVPGFGLGLEIDQRDLKSISSVAGFKAVFTSSQNWGILMPQFQLEWEHEFEDDPASITARFINDPTAARFIVDGDRIDTDYFNLGVGLSALFPGGRSAYIFYEHLLGAGDLQMGVLTIGGRFEF